MSEPKITQHMLMHLNGGKSYSSSTYKIKVNGENVGITRFKRTGGSPRYILTLDTFEHLPSNDTFDFMEVRDPVRLKAWILAHTPEPPPEELR